MKTIYFVIFLTVLLAPAIGRAAGETVAYWRFEASGPLEDSSGNGHALTASGSAEAVKRPNEGAGAFPETIHNTGEANKGIGDLSDDLDRQVDSFQADASGDFDFNGESFTVEALLSPDAKNGFQSAVALGTDNDSLVWRLFINTDTKRMGMNLFYREGKVVNEVFKPLPGFFSGSNYYVAAVFEKISRNEARITFYYKDLSLDGKLSESTAEVDGIDEIRWDVVPLIIGGVVESNQPDFIDEVRITKGALSIGDLLIEK